MRAWCEKNGDFRDFTLSRIAEVEWSRESAELPEPDKDWEQWVTLRMSPHHGLGEEQRKAVERDYAMRNGVLKIKVRKAMEGYLRARPGLAMADGKLPPKQARGMWCVIMCPTPITSSPVTPRRRRPSRVNTAGSVTFEVGPGDSKSMVLETTGPPEF